VNKSIEPIIESPNVFVCLFAGFGELRVKGIHAFLFTPTILKDLFKIFRDFDASFRKRLLIQFLALPVSELTKSLVKTSRCSCPDW
jgi:hypothetical protein